MPLQWRHNEFDGISNHQPQDCLLNRLFKAHIKENLRAPRHWPLWGEFTRVHLMTSSLNTAGSNDNRISARINGGWKCYPNQRILHTTKTANVKVINLQIVYLFVRNISGCNDITQKLVNHFEVSCGWCPLLMFYTSHLSVNTNSVFAWLHIVLNQRNVMRLCEALFDTDVNYSALLDLY